jgi:hypothetical protein
MANRRARAIQADKERSGAKSMQRYRYVNLEKLERLGITQFKPEEGTNFIAVIPPNNEAHLDDEFLPMFCREVRVHRYIGVNNRTFLCVMETQEHFGDPDTLAKLGEPCACCEKANEYKASGEKPELVKDLRPETRELFFVVDVKTLKKGCSTEEMAKADLKVQWWDASSGVKDRVVNASYDPRAKEPEFDVADPDEGRNIIFERTKGQPYKCEDFKTEERKPIPDEWLNQVNFEFDDILMLPEYSEVQSEVQGMPAKADGQDRQHTGRGRQRASRQQGESTSRQQRGQDVPDVTEVVGEEPATQPESDDKIANIRARIAAQKEKRSSR